MTTHTAHHTDSPAGSDLDAEQLRALARLLDQPSTDPGLWAVAGIADFAEPKDPDAWAASHYTAFSHEVPPVASFCLEASGRFGGSIANAAAQLMVEDGVSSVFASHPADHLSNVLCWMADLVESGRTDRIPRVRDAFIAGWLPMAVRAWSQLDDELPRLLANALTGLMPGLVECGDWVDLRGFDVLDGHDVDLDLSNERTSLAHIGSHLVVPARSGLVLTRVAIATVSRGKRLPTGFGSRARVVEGLLRSAGQYDALSDVMRFLLAEIVAHRSVWTQDGQHPAWKAAWMDRLEATSQLVDRLATAQEA